MLERKKASAWLSWKHSLVPDTWRSRRDHVFASKINRAHYVLPTLLPAFRYKHISYFKLKFIFMWSLSLRNENKIIDKTEVDVQKVNNFGIWQLQNRHKLWLLQCGFAGFCLAEIWLVFSLQLSSFRKKSVASHIWTVIEICHDFCKNYNHEFLFKTSNYQL